MNSKSFVKLIFILCVGICATLLLYKFINQEFPEFFEKYNDISSFFIMILILAGGIYSLFSKSNFKTFASQLLIWGTIFFIIVIGYAFRFELNYTKQRIISVLIPSHAWVDTKGELVIARNNDGHFYLDAIINGKKIKFMVDTGASDIALTELDAKKLGFDLSKLNYSRTYSTANGTSKAAPIKLDTVIIGATFKNVEGHIAGSGLDISLLGMSLLERFKGFKIDRDLLILNY